MRAVSGRRESAPRADLTWPRSQWPTRMREYCGRCSPEVTVTARPAKSRRQFCTPEVRIGLVPDVGGTTRLTRTVGYARSKELIMTARMIEAADAEKIGLVNRVVPEGTHLAAAEELAREMARNAPLAVGLAKRIIDKGHGLDKMTFQELEVLAQSSLLLTEDFREGASALAQRR